MLGFDDYLEKYYGKMEALGIDRVMALLDAMIVKADGKVPVLLCFQALKKPDEFCHRRIFAEWCKYRGKLNIPEL